MRRAPSTRAASARSPATASTPGQVAEIDRVCREHADLADDDFVRDQLERWLAE